MEFDATFLIAVISFILFVLIMNKVFYAPILKIMQSRQTFVEQNYNSAKQTREDTQKQDEYRNTELEKSRDEARKIISEQSQKLKSKRSKKIAEYKETVFNTISQERDGLKNSVIETKEVLKDNVVDIAKNISKKILGEYISTNSINKTQIKEQG